MTMVLAYALLFLVAVVVVHVIADRTGLPAAALLTLVGLAAAFAPRAEITLDPELIMTFVIPPLLYSAALNSSMIAIRKNLRTVVSLSVVLVLITALAVGLSLHLLVPAVSLAAAVALGAAVAPPDPVAALAIGRRVGLPERMITLIEGEGLLNDATALTVFTVAVTAATTGRYNRLDARLEFVLVSIGGLAVGVGVAFLVRFLRARVRESLLVNSISLAVPFAAYLVGEELGVSGVLAVVVAGLIVGHDTPRFTSGSSRLQVNAVWRLVDFLLEGFVFLLIGSQAPAVIRGLGDYAPTTVITAAVVTVAVVLMVRPLWLALTQLLPGVLRLRLGGSDRRSAQRLSAREVLVLSWAGTRGVVTLAAIFTLPLVTDSGQALAERHLLLFCAYLVVLVTLVGQGLTFAPLVRAVRLRTDAAEAARVRNEARVAAVEAALVRLEELTDEPELSEATVAALRRGLADRLDRYRRRLDAADAAEDGDQPVSAAVDATMRATRTVIEAQRDELLRWRDTGRLPEASLRILERELDHEEHLLNRH